MNISAKIPLLVLAGPTAVGKTELSLRLAERLNGEIISADSMQVYRGMDIGTAKLMPQDRRGIPHYMIDILDPSVDFDVATFQSMVKAHILDISSRGKLPIMTGGTGFYIQAVLKDVAFSESDGKSAYRLELEQISEQPDGVMRLHEMLRTCDAASAEAIHPRNVKRVIRALEFFKQTGRPISAHNEEQQEKSSPYDFCYFVLNDERSEVYRRINLRVDQMISMGLEQEVKALLDQGVSPETTAMKGLGYKEWLPYFAGTATLDEVIEIIKRDTRHFAKRQLTWFRRESDVIWVNRNDFAGDEKKILDAVCQRWENRHNIEE